MRFRIVDQREIARNVFRLRMEADRPVGWSPGQFFHIRVDDGLEHLLRRPLSLCEAEDDRRFSVVYRLVGRGTRRLARKGPGDELDVLGPLGRGFPLHEGDHRALLIGGGVGVPPLVQLARELRKRGVSVLSLIGFRTAEDVMLAEELAECGSVWILTEDGTAGRRGRVTAALEEALEEPPDRFYACGPAPMLRAVQSALAGRLPGYLSLEERMGCGIGVCMGCVHLCRDPEGRTRYRRVCTEGPVFPAEEVVFS